MWIHSKKYGFSNTATMVRIFVKEELRADFKTGDELAIGANASDYERIVEAIKNGEDYLEVE